MDKITQQRKKLLAYTAIITTLGTVPLTGCSNNFEYEYKDDKLVINGQIDYQSFSTLKLVHVTNEFADWDKYYLVDCCYDRYSGNYYVDIETNKKVYEDSEKYVNFQIDIIVENMIDYIFKYNMIKEEYTIEDVQLLKEKLLSDETIIKTEEVNTKVLKKQSTK